MLEIGLRKLSFTQSKVDRCLCIKKDVLVVTYVDDTIIWSPHESKINKTIRKLKDLNFELTDEGDVDSFLGIQINNLENKSFKMTQPALIKTIVETIGLSLDDSKQHKTPAVNPPLQPYPDSRPSTETYSYRSVIGMLTYLARMTRPDIEYAVHQCARFQINPKIPHYNAIKRIGRYLIATQDKGIIFKPDNNLTEVICYVDADFAGNYDKEYSDDPCSVKSRSGCIILYANCPLIWYSRLQTEIALSTTEAEYIALSQGTREVLPIRSLLLELNEILELPKSNMVIKCTVFEDNQSAKELAICPKNRPRTKHIAVKYHHFREHVAKGIIHVKHTPTTEQLADIFTKPLTLNVFEY